MVSAKEDLQKISELSKDRIDDLGCSIARTVTAENDSDVLEELGEEIGKEYTKAAYRFCRQVIINYIAEGVYSRIKLLELCERKGLSKEKAELLVDPFGERESRIFRRIISQRMKKILGKIKELEKKISSDNNASGDGPKLYR